MVSASLGWWRRGVERGADWTGDGLDGGDAEALVAVEETGAGGVDAGFCISGDGGVAIDDEVAVGNDGSGVDLCAGRGEVTENEGCAGTTSRGAIRVIAHVRESDMGHPKCVART